MSTERYTNNYASTLNGAILSTDTSLVVASATGAPTAGQFRLKIENEILLVTAVAGTTFTVTRAQEGTAAASHADTTAVTEVLTAGAVDQIRSDIAPTTAYASKPAAEKDGKLFLPTDGFQLERDSGSAWSPWGPLFPFKAPDDSLYSWVNQDGAAVSTTKGGIYLSKSVPGSGDRISARVKSAPATPYTVTFGFLLALQMASFHYGGPLFRESATGKLALCGLMYEGGLKYWGAKYASPTSYTADYIRTLIGTISPLCWIRIGDDGTNRTFSISPDGQNFQQLHSIARADGFTTAADQVGFFIGSNVATTGIVDALTLLHYKEA